MRSSRPAPSPLSLFWSNAFRTPPPSRKLRLVDARCCQKQLLQQRHQRRMECSERRSPRGFFAVFWSCFVGRYFCLLLPTSHRRNGRTSVPSMDFGVYVRPIDTLIRHQPRIFTMFYRSPPPTLDEQLQGSRPIPDTPIAEPKISWVRRFLSCLHQSNRANPVTVPSRS